MNKKMTRRCILGAVIGTLVAGPFIMRAVRKRTVQSLPEVIKTAPSMYSPKVREKFYTDWKELYSQWAIVAEPIQKHPSVQLQLNFSTPQSWEFCDIATKVLGTISSIDQCTAANLLEYEVIQGTISLIKPNKVNIHISKHQRIFVDIDIEANQKKGLKIEKHQAVTKNGVTTMTGTVSSRGIIDEKVVTTQLPTEDIVLSLSNSKLRYVTKNEEEFDFDNVNGHQISLVAGTCWSKLSFPFPNTELFPGYSFVLPEDVAFTQNLLQSQKVEKFARFNNATVVKITAEQKLSTNEMQEYYCRYYQFLCNHGVITTEEADSLVVDIETTSRTRFYSSSVYIDLLTGLSLANENLSSQISLTPGCLTQLSLFRLKEAIS
ncbi:MAG: hypothetical protein LBE12_10925 [Planctomycetaceae bacterium]|jgi:hypothetical protein|nr:hypothetical protein [Planctomycetaceae bacterium]